MILRTFGVSFAVTILGLITAYWYAGLPGLAIAAILIVLEVSLSFDNAVVNARVLVRMSDWWQTIFLTVGILIAVFGMRLVFPLVVVGVSADLSPMRAWQLAMERGDADTPGTYGYILNAAHPSIAAFGGMFLLMIFLEWLIEDREHFWLSPVERPLNRFRALDGVTVIAALSLLLGAALWFREHAEQVLIAGIIGLLTYLVVKGFGELFNKGAEAEIAELEQRASAGEAVRATGKAAFFLFLYLEVLDASFSFDGVIGAFAITTDPVIIALGLGVGAMYVRSLTIYLVRQGTLQNYVFLEHGAHWAIGALAVLLLLTIEFHIPEVITGLIGLAFILSAFGWSLRHNKRREAQEPLDLEHVG